MAVTHRGHVFHLAGNPALGAARGALVEHEDGYLQVDDEGCVVGCGEFAEMEGTASADVVDHRGGFLLPGFVDLHLHYPQVYARAAYGGGSLLRWLEGCIFPEEARFRDAEYAWGAARDFCDALVAAGTTCAMVFGSQFPEAQDVLFEELGRRGQRAIVGRTVMIEGPASAAELVTSEEQALALCREEVVRWHPAAGEVDCALVQVALMPRFALSMTPSSLRAFGELHEELSGAGVYFSTHLAESVAEDGGSSEVAEVLGHFGVKRYLDTYDGRFLPGSREGGPSFLGPRSVFAHAVHCEDGELARLAETGSSVAHCPVSQLFLGSGTMPWRRVTAAGVGLGAGSDVGAGDRFSIPEVLSAAHKVHASVPGAARCHLHPAELLHLATLGGAQALALEHRVGNFDAGKEADFVVVDPGRVAGLGGLLRAAAGRGPEALLFALLTTIGAGGVAETYVRGRRLEMKRPTAEA